MQPLAIDDLLTLEEFAARRRELFESHRRYIDRYRRLRVGPTITLVFENRQTIWYKVQEILRVSRLTDAQRVQRELDWYNMLLPAPGSLRASLLMGDGLRFSTGRPFQELKLLAGNAVAHAILITARTADVSIASAHMLEFVCDREFQAAILDHATATICEMDCGDYQHRAMLSGSLTQSLLDDLHLRRRAA